MIKIFDENDRDFKTSGNIVIKPLKCKERKKKSLNGWYIDVEVDIKYADYIIKDKLCVVKTKSKVNPQAFRIENPTKTNKTISFVANHVMFDAERYHLYDVRPVNQNGQNALSYLNEKTDVLSPFTVYSDVENISTAYFIRKNLLEAWAVLEERWGGVFDADNWNISFLKKVGNDNEEVIAYGKNMEEIQIFEDWSNVCTKICPVGYDGITLPEKYLESDVKYEIPYTKTIDFETEIEEEEKTQEKLIEELRENAEKYLEKNKYPKVSYEVTSNLNQNMEIGDNIYVKHPLVTLKTEVLEYEHNILTEKIELLIFGNYTRDVKTKFDNIKESVKNITEQITKHDSVINKQTNIINALNKNGCVYIDDNEILILDKLPKESAKNVWRFGLGGIGYSSNGYEGPFEIAITMDGQINAKFITTGVMSIDRIEGLAEQLKIIVSKIDETPKMTKNIEGIQNIILKNCVEGNLLELHILGHNTDFNMLVPSDELYPSDDLFPVGSGASSTDTYVIEVENEDGTKETYNLGEIVLLSKIDDVQDEYVLKDGKASVIRRIDVENVEVQEEVIEELGEKTIFLKNGTNTITLLNYNAKISAKYVIKNTYTDIFATKTETNAQINIKANEVSTEVNSSVTSSILTLLNNGYLTAEQINSLVEGNTEEIATIKQQLKQTITDNQLQIAISTALEGGISYLKNTLFTINEEGMWIATSEDEFNALYNNKGMYLYSYEQMIAKFDVNGATMNNLKVEGTIETPHSKKMVVAVSGEERIYDFWID